MIIRVYDIVAFTMGTSLAALRTRFSAIDAVEPPMFGTTRYA